MFKKISVFILSIALLFNLSIHSAFALQDSFFSYENDGADLFATEYSIKLNKPANQEEAEKILSVKSLTIEIANRHSTEDTVTKNTYIDEKSSVTKSTDDITPNTIDVSEVVHFRGDGTIRLYHRVDSVYPNANGSVPVSAAITSALLNNDLASGAYNIYQNFCNESLVIMAGYESPGCSYNVTATKWWAVTGIMNVVNSDGSAYNVSTEINDAFPVIANKKGFAYPEYTSPITGQKVPAPNSATMPVVPQNQRTVWTKTAREQYRNYFNTAYTTLNWSSYDIHHIAPRKYGGTNVYTNLIPLEKPEHKKFTAWWSNY